MFNPLDITSRRHALRENQKSAQHDLLVTMLRETGMFDREWKCIYEWHENSHQLLLDDKTISSWVRSICYDFTNGQYDLILDKIKTGWMETMTIEIKSNYGGLRVYFHNPSIAGIKSAKAKYGFKIRDCSNFPGRIQHLQEEIRTLEETIQTYLA